MSRFSSQVGATLTAKANNVLDRFAEYQKKILESTALASSLPDLEIGDMFASPRSVQTSFIEWNERVLSTNTFGSIATSEDSVNTGILRSGRFAVGASLRVLAFGSNKTVSNDRPGAGSLVGYPYLARLTDDSKRSLVQMTCASSYDAGSRIPSLYAKGTLLRWIDDCRDDGVFAPAAPLGRPPVLVVSGREVAGKMNFTGYTIAATLPGIPDSPFEEWSFQTERQAESIRSNLIQALVHAFKAHSYVVKFAET